MVKKEIILNFLYFFFDVMYGKYFNDFIEIEMF